MASAPHPGSEVRAAVVEAIRGSTTAGNHVFDSRDLPLSEDITPAILIYKTGETLDRDHMHDDGLRRRTMTLSIEIYGVGDNAADITDAVAWEVENTLRSDPTLDGKVERIDFVESATAFADNGEQALFVTSMTVEVIYWTHLVTEEGSLVQIVMLGFAPDIGLGHEDDYAELQRR